MFAAAFEFVTRAYYGLSSLRLIPPGVIATADFLLISFYLSRWGARVLAAGRRARGNRAGLFGLFGRGVPRAVVAAGLAATLVLGLVGPVSAAATDDSSSSGQDASAPAAADSGPAPDPRDVAVDGFGDAQGYHLQVGRGSGDYAWQDIAVLHPADLDVPSWTGYQCVSGDGA